MPYAFDRVDLQWCTNLGFSSVIVNPFGFKFHGVHVMPATLGFAVRFLCCNFLKGGFVRIKQKITAVVTILYIHTTLMSRSWDSVVDIVTRCGLDGPGIIS